jgi:cytochrome d ubiquinol oxidase subunit I
VAVGSWLSGYFILVTNAFMQHPVGYTIAADGSLGIDNLGAYLLNPWAWVQFAHNQMAALVTGSFVVAAVGAFYTLRGRHPEQARTYLRAGTGVGLIASLLVAFPTGDLQAKMVGWHQPVTLAAMEGRFESGPMAGVALIGQPNVAAQRLDNPIEIPGALSFLAYGHFGSNVKGLNDFPRESWPDNIELLYYSFHLMITLGTIFIVLMAYAGDTVFTLIGFVGLSMVLGLLFLVLVGREIGRGPGDPLPDEQGKELDGANLSASPAEEASVKRDLVEVPQV